MITIALIDSHVILRTGTQALLQQQMTDTVVLAACDLKHFNAVYSNQIPDLFIIGSMLSEKDQVAETIKSIKKQYVFRPIIIYDESAESFLHFCPIGINGYLLKKNDIGELVECIGHVRSGKRYLCSEVLEMLMQTNLKEKPRLATNGVPLTKKEYEIAQYLSEGLKTSVIAEKLNRKNSTISTFKKHIFQKLDVDNILKLHQVLNRAAVI